MSTLPRVSNCILCTVSINSHNQLLLVLVFLSLMLKVYFYDVKGFSHLLFFMYLAYKWDFFYILIPVLFKCKSFLC